MHHTHVLYSVRNRKTEGKHDKTTIKEVKCSRKCVQAVYVYVFWSFSQEKILSLPSCWWSSYLSTNFNHDHFIDCQPNPATNSTRVDIWRESKEKSQFPLVQWDFVRWVFKYILLCNKARSFKYLIRAQRLMSSLIRFCCATLWMETLPKLMYELSDLVDTTDRLLLYDFLGSLLAKERNLYFPFIYFLLLRHTTEVSSCSMIPPSPDAAFLPRNASLSLAPANDNPPAQPHALLKKMMQARSHLPPSIQSFSL